MIPGSSITFWEILKDKVFRFYLDSLSAYLVLSRSTLKPSALFSCCFFVVILSTRSAFLQARNSKEDHIRTRVALRALVTVLIPTCSLWPSRYIRLASAPGLNIDIPLEVIIEDTIDGVVEFRNPGNGLVDLIGSGKTVNGHIIRINTGWKWWIKCFKWWMLAKAVEVQTGQSKSDCPVCSPEYMLAPSGRLYHSMFTSNRSSVDLSTSPCTSISPTSYPLLCLDCHPCGTIPSLNTGCKATLEFTAFSSSLRTLSSAQILSTAPFVMSEQPRRRPRRLVSVLEQLRVSSGPNTVVESVSNVSVDYEHALRHVYVSLTTEQKIREAWVKILGIKAWRRKMFLVALEAALVHQGWIERWAVQVTVK